MHKLDGRKPQHPLDEFIAELLGAGAVLSQIITQMVRHAAVAGEVPDAVPIPDAARELLTSVLKDVKHRYSRRDLQVTARLLRESTDRICDEVCFVPLDEFEDLGGGEESP